MVVEATIGRAVRAKGVPLRVVWLALVQPPKPRVGWKYEDLRWSGRVVTESRGRQWEPVWQGLGGVADREGGCELCHRGWRVFVQQPVAGRDGLETC